MTILQIFIGDSLLEYHLIFYYFSPSLAKQKKKKKKLLFGRTIKFIGIYFEMAITMVNTLVYMGRCINGKGMVVSVKKRSLYASTSSEAAKGRGKGMVGIAIKTNDAEEK